MTTEFIYIVLGEIFTDTEAFGKAWAEAKAYAKKHHTYIEREVVDYDRHGSIYRRTAQIYVGGCFLRSTTNHPPMIF